MLGLWRAQASAGPGNAIMRRSLILLPTALALLAWPLAGKAEMPTRVAVVGFRFLDTSGEPRDQEARHLARIRALTERVGADLLAGGRFELVDLPATENGDTPPVDAIAAARRAGAGLVVFGAVQKLSSLVLWARASVIDTASGQPVLERLLTFRGDNDESFARAGSFLARQIADGLPKS
jgi:hypothetical protein